MSDAEQRQTMVGAAYAMAAFGFWGFNPIYFKAVDHVPAIEVLGHRVVWSVLVIAVLLGFGRRWAAVRKALAMPQIVAVLLVTTLIIAGNWLLYIWAINLERVLETSLGYFINPLVNISLGALVLGERLRRWQVVAVGLAAIGVLNLTLAYGAVPWIALGLAFSFGTYGLLRKIVAVDSLDGLFIETLLLFPFALALLVHLDLAGLGHFAQGEASLDLLLVLAGPVTALPLIWFTSAARRLRLAVLGFFQYIAPSCQLLLAVFAYGEPFTHAHLVTFLCIWTAIAIFSAESFIAYRRRLRPEPA